MQTIIDLANAVFKPVIDLGAAPIMLIVLTLIAGRLALTSFMRWKAASNLRLRLLRSGVLSVY